MSSNEVLGWGSLSPLPENEGPFPLEIARGYHVRRVCAGFGAAVLAGTKNVIRLPNRKWAHSNDTSDPWSFSNIDSAAFGLHHSLLLRTTDSDGTKKTTGTSTVLAYGSGSQGQVGNAHGTAVLVRFCMALLEQRCMIQVSNDSHEEQTSCMWKSTETEISVFPRHAIT